ncbi:MAG TPA: nucleotidyltransferase domain-containing protein [Candidatus Nanoarchaeia archaeon]|nr:nucleotidyltransferase domain-containing protein [Candidatus Nanoarchaeia archaeon]
MSETDKKPSSLGEQMSHSDKYHSPQSMPVPSEAVKEADKIKNELEDFKKKLIKKFPFTITLSILPAPSFKWFEEEEGLVPEEVSRKPLHLYMIVPEDEYKNIAKKIKPEVLKLIQEGKHNIWVHIKTPVDVWNYGLDSKFELIDAVGSSYPLHDKGLLGALRVANIHKTLVLRKFEKYVATYAVGGSLVRGTAGKDSDVDTFVVIDDTDVKKMPRMHLLEKLRGFIYDYIREASALAGVKNILNVQVYLLTDFWQSVKDATPVIFTFIRDGVPMHDRGTFLPWKLLLKMGKIKPSPEAVDTFMKYGDQNESLVKRRLIDAMVDIYWGVITPTQALMMLAGHAPPVPKTIVEDVRREFVEKEKIMSPADLKTLAWVVGLYKDYEHAKLNSISGEEIDKLLKASKEYDAHLKSLRKKLEGRLIEQTAKHVYDGLFGLLQNILGNHAPDKIIELFQKELIKHGKIPERYLPVLKEVAKIKERLKKITQGELDMVRRDAEDLMNKLVEYTQRRDMVKGEKGVLHLICGDKKADLILTHEAIFVVIEGKIQKVGPHSLVESNAAELEKAMHTQIDAKDTRLPSSALSILKKEFGEFTILF